MPALDIEQWPIGDVKPYAKNPRAISDRAVEMVSNSLNDFGFRQPIVVDAKGVIIAGHTRHLAAQRLGMLTVPVHVAKDLDAKKARAYRLADNKTGELADWLDVLLAEEVAALAIDGVDLLRFGFEKDALDLLAFDGNFDAGTADEQGALDKKTPTTCPKCGHEFTP